MKRFQVSVPYETGSKRYVIHSKRERRLSCGIFWTARCRTRQMRGELWWHRAVNNENTCCSCRIILDLPYRILVDSVGYALHALAYCFLKISSIRLFKQEIRFFTIKQLASACTNLEPNYLTKALCNVELDSAHRSFSLVLTSFRNDYMCYNNIKITSHRAPIKGPN